MDYEGIQCSAYRERFRKDIVWAHAKYDGHHTTFKISSQGVMSALTTKGYDIWPKLKHHPWATVLARKLPLDSTIYAEIFVPGKPASAVKTAIKDGSELYIRGFAVLRLRGVITHASLVDVSDFFKISTIPFAEPLVFLQAGWTEDYLLKLAEKLGVEGWVLKGGHLTNWYKLKIEKTIDLIVTGFTDGTGNNIGLVGSFKCSVVLPDGSLQEVARAGGLTDDVRLDIDEEKDLGRIVEVKYQYVGAKGRLRHPRFLRYRDDKNVARCGLDQDPNLEEYWT